MGIEAGLSRVGGGQDEFPAAAQEKAAAFRAGDALQLTGLPLLDHMQGAGGRVGLEHAVGGGR